MPTFDEVVAAKKKLKAEYEHLEIGVTLGPNGPYLEVNLRENQRIPKNFPFSVDGVRISFR